MQVALVCQLILEAIKREKPNKHLISVDEKTGIQALERIAEDQPMQKGKVRKLEYEYERHGTSCLMAAQHVANGKVMITTFRLREMSRTSWLLFRV